MRANLAASAVAAALLSQWLAGGPSAALGAVEPIRRVVVARGPVWVDAGGKWAARLPDAERKPGQRMLLFLKVRVDTAGHGGCNFVHHVAVNDRPLNQPRGWPRLLNKPIFYHLRHYKQAFCWYRRSTHGWSTIFGPDFKAQSVVEGQDFSFLWEVSDLVLPGQANTIVVTHLQPMMPKWTKGRGKLVLRDVELWLASGDDVSQAAQALQDSHDAKPTIVPAADAIRGSKVGQRPFELVRTSRQDLPAPLVTFDDLTQWEALLYRGATAKLERSREEQIWGDHVGKVTYRLPSTDAAVLLRPREPIPIAGEFDCANLWVYGGPDYFLKAAPSVPTVYVRVEDAKGEVHELSLGSVNQNYWFPQHGKFAAFRWPGQYGWPTYESWAGDGNARIDFPARLKGILLGDCRTEKELVLWLDSLAFYREKRTRPPIIAAPQTPKYPTTPDTILPTCKIKHRNTLEQRGDAYALVYEGADGRLCYTVKPSTGTLSDVTAAWEGKQAIRPLANGGIVYGDALSPAAGKKISVRLTAQAIETQWQTDDASGAHTYTITYRIRGKTLVVDLEARDTAATAFAFGTAHGLTKPKLIEVPYLSIEPVRGPNVVLSDRLFILGLLDWYNTSASTFDGTAELVSETEASFNRGSRYLPCTDGKRNSLRERVFLTVSPDFHEVLPNIPNPPSPRLKWASKYMYNMVNPPLRPKWLQLLSTYGVDHQLALCWGRLWCTRQGDSYTYRVKPHPGYSIDEVAAYAAKVRSYGHVFGIGAGGRDFCPLSKHWDENLVALEPDGNWRLGWPSNYVINHDAARRLARQAGTQLRKQWGPSVLYFDVGTQPSPWRCANDYNALVPGAGTLRQAFRSVCDLMLEMRQHHEFIVSEGGHRWMYAGLSEGDYATIPSRTPKYKRPIIVDFDLLKLHPLQHGVGMGHGPNAFYPWQGGAAEEGKAAWKREGIDRYVAATIAYGHMGCLTNCAGWPLSRTIRYFALVWPLQQEYLTDTVEEIRYHDGKRFVSPSEALATDAYLKGRVYVRYARGLEVVANCSASESWEARAGEASYVLPPFGFVARRDGHVLSYVAMQDGQRVDYVQSPELVYASAPDKFAKFPMVALQGSVMLRRQSTGAWRVIPCSGLGYFRWQLDKARPFMNDAAGVQIDPKKFCREVSVNAARLMPGAHVLVPDEGLVSRKDGWVTHRVAPGKVGYPIHAR